MCALHLIIAAPVGKICDIYYDKAITQVLPPGVRDSSRPFPSCCSKTNNLCVQFVVDLLWRNWWQPQQQDAVYSRL